MKNFKNTVMIGAVCALSIAILSPSTSFATETEALKLLNQLHEQMDQISELAGLEKSDSNGKDALPTEDESKDTDKKETQKEAAYITELKESFDRNDISVKSVEEILEKYPKTIKGKEGKLVNLLIESHDLKLQAADLIYSLTGEKLQVNPPRIPEEYSHLIRY